MQVTKQVVNTCLVEVVIVQRVAAAKDCVSQLFQRLGTHPEVLAALLQPLTEPPAGAGILQNELAMRHYAT